MKKASRFLSLLMAGIMVFGLAACGSGGDGSGGQGDSVPAMDSEPAADTTPAPDPDEGDEPAEVTYRDLGGMEIIVSDWWTDNEAAEEPATTLREEEWRDYRDSIFEAANFSLKRRGISGWGDYLELFTTSVMAQDPAADIFIMSSGWAMQLQNQGLLYPLNTLDSIDLNDPKWNSTVKDIFTAGDGNTYAITNEQFIEPRCFLFYNKRLFEEAGIDPEEPYELQARGEWTWDKFMEYCEKLTRDTDGDGIADVYGYVGHEPEAVEGFVFSNGGDYIGKNADGTFYNAMTEPNFVEAIQFAKSINERGYWCPSPPDAEWDWFVTGFSDGHAAMIMRGAYSSSVWNERLDDEYGMLLPPKGPRADDYNLLFSENVFVIPFNISKERAEELMYAFNLYTQPLPYDLANPDFWKDGAWGYQRFRDTQAVDNTLSMFYEDRYSPNNRDFVPGIDWGPTFDWGSILGEETANEKIESAKPVVDAAIDAVNRVIKGEPPLEPEEAEGGEE